MSAAYRTAMMALLDIRRRLADPSTSDAARALALLEFDEVLHALNRADHRTSTLAMAKRVQDLDRQLSGRDRNEVNSAIMQRLGIGRTRLYELRAVRLSPDGEAVKY